MITRYQGTIIGALLTAVLLLVGLWALGPAAAQAAPAATITVDTITDENDNNCGDGDCSLRDAVATATAGDTIIFDAGLSGQTITLTLGEIAINQDLTIDGSALAEPITISGNNASRVLNVSGGNVTFHSLTIADGNVQTTDCGTFSLQCGGGIMVQNSNVAITITHSTLSGNSAAFGGAIMSLGGDVTISNSTFSGNSAGGRGGGFYSRIDGFGNVGTATVTNSTFSGNTAGDGGGIYNDGNMLTLIHSTLSGNSASTGGGLLNEYGATLDISHTIIANSPTGGDCGNGATINDNGYNFVEDGSCGFAAAGDPYLMPLDDNGGPTETHALLPGSGAIDSGDCTGGPAADQRGVARPQDTTCDLGAYEGGALQCGVSAGASYTFPNQSGVSIYVESETDLDCLYVDEIAVNHPNATGATDGQHLRTGKYWQIGGLQADGATAATTFNVDLTLPYATADANTRACQWLEGAGPGFGWNCFDGGMGTTYVTNVSVTREDVTSFSQWAVGDNVGPTAVTLQSSQAGGRFGGAAVFATFLTLFALTGAIILLRKKRAG